MNIKPKLDGKFPVGAVVTFNEKDLVELAEILSHATRADLESARVLLYKLAAVCEGVTSEAQVAGLDHDVNDEPKGTKAYVKVRTLFDPEYEGG